MEDFWNGQLGNYLGLQEIGSMHGCFRRESLASYPAKLGWLGTRLESMDV